VKTIELIGGNLIKKAMDGDTASMIFYLKTQAGWRDKQDINLSNEDGSLRPIGQLLIKFVNKKEVENRLKSVNEARD
jgi:hypothetical protein